ncbi:MAG: hypothetical protein Q8R69_24240 [Telluria sp.]|nr:hypothetical protein [Telluria sp.]
MTDRFNRSSAERAIRRAHSTPDPDAVPPPEPKPNPVPDDVPLPTHAPVEEPTLPEPPIKAGAARRA